MGRLSQFSLRPLTLGLAVDRDAVRAVAVQGGRVRWQGERPRGASLEADCLALLRAAPRPRGRRARLMVAFGAGLARVKTLDGLPAAASEATLARIVAVSLGRYFCGAPGALVPTQVRRTADGVLAAALDAAAVAAVMAAARRAGCRLTAIVPAAVLPAAVTDHAAVIAVLPERALRVAWRPATAHGAARVSPRRAVAAWAACLVTMAACLAAPGIAAHQRATRAEVVLEQLHETRADAARTEHALRAAETRLAELEAWQAQAGGTLPLLHEVGRALPAMSALTLLRVDTLGGMAVLLTPRASTVLTALERGRQATSVEIVGPISRERIGEVELERVTVRFARGRPTALEPR